MYFDSISEEMLAFQCSHAVARFRLEQGEREGTPAPCASSWRGIGVLGEWRNSIKACNRGSRPLLYSKRFCSSKGADPRAELGVSVLYTCNYY